MMEENDPETQPTRTPYSKHAIRAMFENPPSIVVITFKKKPLHQLNRRAMLESDNTQGSVNQIKQLQSPTSCPLQTSTP
jgi:hypothetical protein